MKLKELISATLSVTLCLTMPIYIKAEDDKLQTGDLYVNEQRVEEPNTILIKNDVVYVPLRSTLEAMGSSVYWNEENGRIYFDFLGIEYVCKMVALNPYFPNDKSIMICETGKENSIINSDYIQLNPMAANGAYTIIEDRTYLSQQTGKRLFEALGCKVDIGQTGERFYCRVSLQGERFDVIEKAEE